MQIQQQPNTKVPVKLSSINFDGIFSKWSNERYSIFYNF